jgi:hypothetical protein
LKSLEKLHESMPRQLNTELLQWRAEKDSKFDIYFPGTSFDTFQYNVNAEIEKQIGGISHGMHLSVLVHSQGICSIRRDGRKVKDFHLPESFAEVFESSVPSSRYWDYSIDSLVALADQIYSDLATTFKDDIKNKINDLEDEMGATIGT